MRSPHAVLSDAVIRLRAANDRLAKHLASTEQRKSIPPSSPWAKAVVALTAPAKVRRP